MADVHFPKNNLTRMMEEVAARNAAGGSRAGVASATPMPTAQSADVGRLVPETAPLTPDEKVELDRLAIEAGVKDERLEVSLGGEAGQYKSLEEALAAGAPIEKAAEAAQLAPLPPQRGTAREFLARSTRLPDFRRVQTIDLVQNQVWVDDMSFPITEVEAVEFKRFVVEKARDSIMEKLTEADNLFVLPDAAEDAPDGGATGEES